MMAWPRHLRPVSLCGLCAVNATPGLNKKARPAPVVAPIYAWTGWYVGVNAGAIINDTRYSLNPAGCFLLGCATGGVAANVFRQYSTRLSNADVTAGGQIGYNYNSPGSGRGFFVGNDISRRCNRWTASFPLWRQPLWPAFAWPNFANAVTRFARP
jgi:hypothetical protein